MNLNESFERAKKEEEEKGLCEFCDETLKECCCKSRVINKPSIKEGRIVWDSPYECAYF